MLVYILVGGALGTLARYGLQGWIQTRAGTAFPAGTLAINIAGTFVLGFLLRFATGTTTLSPEWRAGLTIGFCGAFTTMSTFGYETFTLLRDGQALAAGLYVTGTVGGGLLAVWGGSILAARLL